MIDAFNQGQFKLLMILVGLMGFTSGLISLFNPEITIWVCLHLMLSTFFGCGVILAVGSACKTPMQLSALMLIIICHSVWITTSFDVFGDDMGIWRILGIDIILALVSVVTIWWGSKKLWKGDFL